MQPSCPDRRGLFFRSAAGLGTLARRGCTCWKRHGHHFVQVTAVPLALLLFTAFDAGHLGNWPQSHRCIISPLIIIFLPFQPVFPLNVPLGPFGLCNLLLFLTPLSSSVTDVPRPRRPPESRSGISKSSQPLTMGFFFYVFKYWVKKKNQKDIL